MKSSVNRIALALMLGLVVSVGAHAQLFEWEISSQAGPAGFVVNDLYYTPSGENPIMELLVSATGQIFQEPGGDVIAVCGPPVSETNADTFVTMGGDTFATLPAGLLIAGGAVDIGGDPAPMCDENIVNMAWAPGSGQFLTPPGVRRLMSRLTLADTTESEALVFVQDGSVTMTEAFPISGGVVGIPEPSSIAMLVIGVLAFLRRRV